MLTAIKKQVLSELIAGASYEELVWINGYLAGVLAVSGDEKPVAVQNLPGKITLLYGTETGNAKSLAVKLAGIAKKQGITVKLAGLDQYRPGDLVRENTVYVVISTQGDGEPPAAAKKFYDHLHTPLQLPDLKYGVIALGDSAYPLFCQAGVVTDTQLAQAGATRIAAVCKCDTDYETTAISWFEQALLRLPAGKESRVKVGTDAPWVKKQYTGIVRTNINLNDHGAAKETFHIELEAEDVVYEPGDSLSILPQNPWSVVEQIIALSGIDGNKTIPYRDGKSSIAFLLQNRLNILYLQERTVKQYATLTQQEIPEARIGLADLLRIYPVADAERFEQVIGILEPITPRLYSVSSAPSAHGGELHLTVSRNRFHVGDTAHYGLCSGYLSQLEEGAEISFGIHANRLFRLPAPDADIIMIGPGTGIAPFRSFLSERGATNATGRNWLFFGEQHFQTDFLYQTEIQDWVSTGLLTKVSLAFSRDQQQKVYVQHKLLQQAQEVYDWIQGGAYVYVCGSRTPMSEDVEQALLQVFVHAGSHTAETAETLLRQLKEAGRYLLDVY